MSGCSRCKKWIVSTFICLDCRNLFKVKHRDNGDPIGTALRKNISCTNCQGRNFELHG